MAVKIDKFICTASDIADSATQKNIPGCTIFPSNIFASIRVIVYIEYTIKYEQIICKHE